MEPTFRFGFPPKPFGQLLPNAKVVFYHSGKFDDETSEKRRRRRAMHEAAGAPLQLTNGACVAAQSTGAVALRGILQARSLALQLHRERAIVDRSTDMCTADHHVGRALREDNHGPRMLARTRSRRASCRPGGGRPSSPPERPCPKGQPCGAFWSNFYSSISPTRSTLARVSRQPLPL